MWFPFSKKKEKMVLEDPPEDTDQIVVRCLDVLKKNFEDDWIQLHKETSPRWIFCMPSSLICSEKKDPSLDFVLLHTLVPQNEKKLYHTLQGSCSIHIHKNYLTCIYSEEEKVKRDILIEKRETLYTSYYKSVEILYITNSLKISYDSMDYDFGSENDLPIKRNTPIRKTNSFRMREPDSDSSARILIEREIKKHHSSLPGEEVQLIVKDFFRHVDEFTDKFIKDLSKVFDLEAKIIKNSDSTFNIEDWTIDKVSQIQHHILLSFMSICNRGGERLSLFSHLLQPIEDIVLSLVHEPVMKLVIVKNRKIDAEYSSKLEQMRLHPLTHQPPGIHPNLRRVSLENAAKELKKLESEKGKTPLQKLLCLQRVFIYLQSNILSLTPPTNYAPSPPVGEDKNPKNFDENSKRKSRYERRPRTLTEKELTVPEYRRRSMVQVVNRQDETIQLLLLLLIYRSPENFHAHLSFIRFHTNHDDDISSLNMYYMLFQTCVDMLLHTVPLKRVESPRMNMNTLYFHSYIWGLVNNQIETFPVIVESLRGIQLMDVACGEKHIIALARNGRLFTYGVGTEGQLGHGDDTNLKEFKEVEILSSQNIVTIDGGGTHSAAITQSGKLYCWGGNLWGQIGMGIVCDSISIPKQVLFDSTLKVIRVSCGAAHSIALLADGTVWSWGLGAGGRLGHGNEFSLSSPKKITGFPKLTKISEITCGWNHAICITSDEHIYTFGNGSDGQLGTGKFQDELSPVKIERMFGYIIDCAAFNHTMLLTSTGLFTWGWGEHGELGLGSTENQCSPCLVDVGEHEIIEVTCGAFHSAAVSKDGLLLTWGLGTHGQLGHGDTSSQTSPYVVQYLQDKHIFEVACGFSHTIVIQASQIDEGHKQF